MSGFASDPPTDWDDVAYWVDGQRLADHLYVDRYVGDSEAPAEEHGLGPRRVTGIHPTAVIGERPEMRDWIADDSKPWVQPFVHPTARVNAFVTVDGGCERSTYIGENVLLMAHVHVGHDAIVLDDCELAPGAVVGGYAHLEGSVKLGMNAVVKPKITIGHGARIGAGAVVTKDVPAGETWAGVPARKLDK